MSTFWKQFSDVVALATKNLAKFNDSILVACNTCMSVYVFNSKNGTSTLAKHVCSTIINNQSLTAFSTHRAPTQAEKRLVVATTADMCTEDILPFHMVKGSGFKAYTHTILDIGVNSSHGLNVVELLPTPITFSCNINDRAALWRKTLSTEIIKHVESDIKMASTTDIWTDNINKTSFLSVTSHMINCDFILHHRILACCPIFGSHNACKATLAMKLFKQPTLKRVCYFRHNLLLHSDMVTKDEKFIIKQIHVIPSLLDPRIKRRLVKYSLSEEQIGKAKENLKSLMKEHIPKHDQKDYERGFVKKPKTNDEDDSNDSEGKAVEHIDSVYQTAIEAHIHGLLFWWKTQQTSFSILSQIVHSVLAIPASSAKLECNFSDAGNTMTKKQNWLNRQN
ncbi:hypothetical protein Mp_4g23020 [Marchantia polymorpha subsp. ruderalis]|uniref:HAT C-terminal dimerisation domain-containing protein n=2 Tax=Marchantia polymorpha TaxID=3197 RepID=A0AAF6BCU2_MARPO|nr:hypothetical protein MARPO_0020s0064 [Marchantia polymorpha]BBN09826.1 hypothetical protein Mp_4g23020 [Marchantia polymorpha subsp. ruderalis]|eukprot:PTQ44401.1 hypothetical protein MARPO_0020s0064 [Marchantia polymorpha]